MGHNITILRPSARALCEPALEFGQSLNGRKINFPRKIGDGTSHFFQLQKKKKTDFVVLSLSHFFLMIS